MALTIMLHRSLSFSVNQAIPTEAAYIFYPSDFLCGTSQPLSRVIARKRTPGTDLVVDDISSSSVKR